jgi:5-formyltetrahydrofolate cyclo-ligase
MQGKNEFRQAAFERRSALDATDCAEWSRQMTARFLSEVPLPEEGAVISAYAPVNNEIDVFPLMTQLVARGYRCAIPYNVEKDHILDFLEWTPQTALYKGLYNIPHPDPAQAAALLPDFLIVPLVAFDVACNRIGYGSGYFDRTFAHLRKFHRFRAVGVAYEAQKYPRVPVDRHDYRLDGIVTEAAVYTTPYNGKPS